MAVDLPLSLPSMPGHCPGTPSLRLSSSLRSVDPKDPAPLHPGLPPPVDLDLTRPLSDRMTLCPFFLDMWNCWRATVIVDKEGIVRYVKVQEILTARDDQEILEALKKIA